MSSNPSTPTTPATERGGRTPRTPSSGSSRKSPRTPGTDATSPPLRRLESSPEGSTTRSKQARRTPTTPGSEVGSEISSNAMYTERDAMPPPTSPGSRTTYSRTGVSSASGLKRNGPGRGDIETRTEHHHMLNVDGAPATEAYEGSTTGGPKVVIWGTRVCVDTVKDDFTRFLEEYREEAPDQDELAIHGDGGGRQEMDADQPFYLQRLHDIQVTGDNHLDVNLEHVRKFKLSLYKLILCYPADVIPYLDIVANETYLERVMDGAMDEDDERQIEVRPYNAEKTRNMRDLNPEDIDQLISITGMVIRSSAVIPEMRIGFFQCVICKSTTEREVDRGRIEEPVLCRNCNNNHTYQLIHNRCCFMDKQIVKLQESPDDMPAGQTPHTVTLYAHGNLVDHVQPGDRVTVTGIYRAFPLRVNPKMRTVKSIYKTHIDVLHFRKFHGDRLMQGSEVEGEEGRMFFSESRIEDIKTLSQAPDVYERLAHALAPSIYEHVDIKKGILCLLLGGTKKNFSTVGRGHFRSELNILLCGDPGTSKSQMLQYVHKLVPRGQYCSGKGSSAVGLTAYVTRDPETKHFVLQTGALVLSDNGVCCIDEFDKMNDGTRAILHEVMEQQTLSIAKAGIICQLNARASVLAAANPVDSCWNKDKTIIENLQLPHTLLSRFDLIFLLVDPQDEYFDRRLATHLVSLYYKTEEAEREESLDMHLIRDYIAYAKENVHPKLSEGSSQLLIDKYLNMRKVGKGRGVVSAYPRQLESLIRLAEAHAKIHLRETVTEDDVEEAHRLHREALKQAATDPETGRVDVNILSAGMSDTTRKHIAELSRVLRDHMGAKPFGHQFPLKKVLLELRQNSDVMITNELFDETVADLIKNELIVRTGDKIRLLRAS